MKTAVALLGLVLLTGCAGQTRFRSDNPNEAALLGAIIANRPQPVQSDYQPWRYLPMPPPPMQQQTMRLQTTCSTYGQQTYCQ